MKGKSLRHGRLREAVAQANRDIVQQGLVTLTWGNVSAVDRSGGVMAIKPSGVEYGVLRAADIVLLSLADGTVVDSALRPSSDSPTHLALYRRFEAIGAVVHTHSPHATAWAQLGKPLPCFGTTHADHFYGPIPVARRLRAGEIDGAYEQATGMSIVETFRAARLDPLHMPAVLLPGHAPFVWGVDLAAAVQNAVALERVARMALLMGAGRRTLPDISTRLLRKHFFRKHGPGAYYGQAGAPETQGNQE